jgi:hypothetical protein
MAKDKLALVAMRGRMGCADDMIFLGCSRKCGLSQAESAEGALTLL